MISTPFTSCGVLTRQHIVITEPDMRGKLTKHFFSTYILSHLTAAKASQESKEAAKKLVKTENPGWYKAISEREDVLSAILVCTIMSLVLLALIVTGKSTLVHASCILLQSFTLHTSSIYMTKGVIQKVSLL